MFACNSVRGLVPRKEEDVGTTNAVGALSLGQVVKASAQLQGVATLGVVVEDGGVVACDRVRQQGLCSISALALSLGMMARVEGSFRRR